MSRQFLSASAGDYLKNLQALLPRGRFWTRLPDSKLTQFLYGLAGEFARFHNRMLDLLIEADPREATETLADWEADYGLPSACTGPTGTVSERQADLTAKETSLGGQNADYYIARALDLGLTITITDSDTDPESTPSRMGVFRMGDRLIPVTEQFIWTIAAGPISATKQASLECLMESIKPAHTGIIYDYS